MAVTCPEGSVYNEQLGICLDPNLNLGSFNQGSVNGIDLSAITDNKPSPVVQGEDGNMYASNAFFTPSGWQTEPDYTTPLYFFHQPLELGDPREIYYVVNDDGTVTQFGAYRTEEDIRGYWEADEGMGYFKEANPDLDFDTWFSFVKDSSALNASGLNRSDNPAEFQALVNQYGINTSFQNPDGDLFQWNGSSFTKTFKTDDSFNVGGLIMSLAATALTGGLMNAGYLGSFLKGLSAAQQAAVINGVSTAVQTGGDLKAIAGSVVGSWAGGTLGGLADLGSDAANSALSSSIASAIEQGIVNGEIDVDSMLQSGILGGLGAIGKDLVTSFVDGTGFDFGGLISEDSDLFEFLNGAPNIYGEYVSGALGGIKDSFNQFVEQNITGGEWWSSATESYNEIQILDNTTIGDDGNIIPAGSVVAIGYDGSKTIFDSFDAFVNAGFTEMAGTNPLWGLISSGLDSVPDSWYKQLEDWINNATSGSAGGTYSTEGGTTITTTAGTDGDGEGEDPSLFSCSTVNRVQTPSALEAADCGPCIEGYQADEFGECVQADTTDVCPAGQVYNEVVGACVDELFFTPGQPCNTEDGQQGVFDESGGCYVPAGNGTDGSGNGTDGTDGTDGTGGTVVVEGTGEADPCRNNATVESGCEQCEDGSSPDDHVGGNCSGPLIDTSDPYNCKAGNPGPTSFSQGAWNAYCWQDYCNDGTKKETIDGVYGANCSDYVAPTPVPSCADPNRKTNQDGSCGELCSDGTIPDQHEGGLCGNEMISTGGTGGTSGTGGGETDCTLVECESPRPEGAEGVQWDKCCTDVTTTTTGGGGEDPDCTLVECESPRPEGEQGDVWDKCCTDTTTTTTGSGGSGGGGGGGGGGGYSTPGPDLAFAIAGQPETLQRQRFGGTQQTPDTLASLFAEQPRSAELQDFPIMAFLQKGRIA
jgi:hypothetical protein